MFEGFELTTIDTGEAQIRLRHGGSGPPLLMMHGNPQTHSCGTRSRRSAGPGVHAGAARHPGVRRQLEAAPYRRSRAVLEAQRWRATRSR